MLIHQSPRQGQHSVYCSSCPKPGRAITCSGDNSVAGYPTPNERNNLRWSPAGRPAEGLLHTRPEPALQQSRSMSRSQSNFCSHFLPTCRIGPSGVRHATNRSMRALSSCDWRTPHPRTPLSSDADSSNRGTSVRRRQSADRHCQSAAPLTPALARTRFAIEQITLSSSLPYPRLAKTKNQTHSKSKRTKYRYNSM